MSALSVTFNSIFTKPPSPPRPPSPDLDALAKFRPRRGLLLSVNRDRVRHRKRCAKIRADPKIMLSQNGYG